MANISKTHIYIATRFLCSGILTHSFNSCLNLTAKDKDKDKNALSKLYLSWCLANSAMTLADSGIKNFSYNVFNELAGGMSLSEKISCVFENLGQNVCGIMSPTIII
jgi:hypothetical protein